VTDRRRMHAVVHGRVQGVGFRDATWREARRLGLDGWVKNRFDGTVEVTAEGDQAALRELEQFLRQGPRMAKVASVEAHFQEPRGDLGPFQVTS
jgi:acylphosphatase